MEQPAETGLWVYGVVRAAADRVPADLVGIDGAAVRAVEHGEIAAVVAEIALERPPGRRADLVAHGEVLDRLMRTDVVVPVRFGSVLAEPASVVEDLLEPNADYFASLLDELSGRTQYNLRATYHEPVVLAEVVEADPDIAELSARTRDLPEDSAYGDRVRLGELVSRAMDDKRDQDSASLLEAILPWVAAHAVRAAGGLDHLLDVALLVDDDRRGDFEEQLENLAESVHERIRLRLVGPVAPYDFVGDA
ncbi:MAG TPA: GvpL/GvpF family gas vesicle protein [Nocardioidaceae bacterium]|nr:GvpL/GvpF family gas vesicle protein [Nocardioidaceae bacterium]